jgi:hypothetical protein
MVNLAREREEFAPRPARARVDAASPSPHYQWEGSTASFTQEQ